MMALSEEVMDSMCSKSPFGHIDVISMLARIYFKLSLLGGPRANVSDDSGSGHLPMFHDSKPSYFSTADLAIDSNIRLHLPSESLIRSATTLPPRKPANHMEITRSTGTR